MRTYSRLPGGVDEVDGDVEGLDEAAESVDGDEKDGVGLDHGVVDPQQAAEEGNHVGH